MRKIVALLTVLMLSAFAFGQTRTITGTVKDEKGVPIPFATVAETGTRNATQADVNGDFSIRITGNQLTINATGHQSQTITVRGGTANAVLATQNAQVTEVLVTTALGVRRQAKQLGYSTATINNQELTESRPTNLTTGLAAKVFGVLW